MNEKFRFSLRQLLLAVALVGALLGTGKWCYIKYFDPVIPVSAERERHLEDILLRNVGRRISVCGRYQCVGSESSYQVVWIGRVAIAVEGLGDVRALPSPLADGAAINITGRLTDAPKDIKPLVRLRRLTWYDEFYRYHEEEETVYDLILFHISVEDASIPPSTEEEPLEEERQPPLEI